MEDSVCRRTFHGPRNCPYGFFFCNTSIFYCKLVLFSVFMGYYAVILLVQPTGGQVVPDVEPQLKRVWHSCPRGCDVKSRHRSDVLAEKTTSWLFGVEMAFWAFGVFLKKKKKKSPNANPAGAAVLRLYWAGLGGYGQTAGH